MVKLIKTKKENEKSAGWKMWGRSDKGLLKELGELRLGASKIRGMGAIKSMLIHPTECLEIQELEIQELQTPLQARVQVSQTQEEFKSCLKGS